MKKIFKLFMILVVGLSFVGCQNNSNSNFETPENKVCSFDSILEDSLTMTDDPEIAPAAATQVVLKDLLGKDYSVIEENQDFNEENKKLLEELKNKYSKTSAKKSELEANLNTASRLYFKLSSGNDLYTTYTIQVIFENDYYKVKIEIQKFEDITNKFYSFDATSEDSISYDANVEIFPIDKYFVLEDILGKYEADEKIVHEKRMNHDMEGESEQLLEELKDKYSKISATKSELENNINKSNKIYYGFKNSTWTYPCETIYSTQVVFEKDKYIVKIECQITELEQIPN